MDQPTKRGYQPSKPGYLPRARRRAPKGNTKATCRRGVLGLGPNLALAILDVSEAGIRLRVRELLEPGQEVEIGLEGLANSRPLRVPASVVWCVPTAEGDYCVGLQFDRRLTYADLHMLAKP
jgi:hypothetical protein